MNWIIDAHEDLAYNHLCFGRDYQLSAAEIRTKEIGTPIPEFNGDSVLGWEDHQRGQVAVIFGTLFAMPHQYSKSQLEKTVYKSPAESKKLFTAELDYYKELQESGKFLIIKNRKDLNSVISTWENSTAKFPESTHPVGLVILMEGAEAIGDPSEMERWWESGVRVVGPVWAGTRFCGGTIENGEFTREGYHLLDIMGELGFILDISHMTEKSSLQALERYQGPVLASHANARALVNEKPGERHLTDHSIRRLIERDGVIGVVPHNSFLKTDWKKGDNRDDVTLDTLISHIDHICQISGNSCHVGLGTDFDGGFGWPNIPLEINTISDLQKLHPLLNARGYNELDIKSIFGENFRRILGKNLPE